MSRILETCLWHGSDWIAWIDRSGDARPAVRPLVDVPLVVRFTGRPPADLTVVHQRGRTLLWRRRPDTLRRTEAGEVDAAGRLRPVVPNYALAGELSDPAGRYLPRRFALAVGSAGGHGLAVYRAPLGVHYRSAGGLQGRVLFEDGTPAAWALIEVEVTPPLTGPLPFVAQADGHGEFRLALDRLPALTKDAPTKKYAATLRVRASLAAAQAWQSDRSLADPDLLPLATAKPPANFKITPGEVSPLASPGKDHLVLLTTPPGP